MRYQRRGGEADISPGGPAAHDTRGDRNTTFDDVELLEDQTRRISGGSLGRQLGVSLPGVLVSGALVLVVAFGAGVRPNLLPASAEGIGTQGGGAAAGGNPDETGADTVTVLSPEATDDVPGGPSVEPSEAPTPTPEPTATATPAPTPTPEPTALSFAVKLDGAKAILDWSPCTLDGFHSYKVIRSTDSTLAWPVGSGDTVIWKTADPAKTAVADGDARAGKTNWYGVVALVERDGELVVGCRTDVTSVKIPAPKPVADSLDLTVGIVDGRPKLVWTPCSGLDFDYYKVVRSYDGTVSWPGGEHDTLIAVVSPGDATKAWDREAPSGTKLYYRVFCVRSTDAGYRTLAASAVRGILTPTVEPVPVPDPVTLAFEANLADGGVVLHWARYSGELFVYYKVVRSMTTGNPSYFPWTDGTELISAIGDSSVTGLTDSGVASGQTWFYRVQAIGKIDGQKVLLGQTAVVAVTIP